MVSIISIVSIGIATSFDDGAIVGTGGTAALIGGSHPSIRMESEVVRIDKLPTGRVKAVFVFKNYGKAVEVPIGFPGAGGGVDTTKDSAELGNFQSFVDGKRIQVKIVPEANSGDEDWKVWYTKRVHFEAGQTHIIEDDYTGGGGGDSSGFRSFQYILRTGASWHGAIGKATVSVDLSGLAAYSPIDLQPSGSTTAGSVATWVWSNLKPTKGNDVLVSWYPAFRNIYVNGTPVGLAEANRQEVMKSAALLFNQIGRSNTDELPYCVRRDRAIRIPASLAASWLGANLRPTGTNRYRIEFGKRWAEFSLGSTTVLGSDGKKTPMEFPASSLTISNIDPPRKVQIVGFASIVQALGGKTKMDTKNGRLDLWLNP